MNLTEWGKSVKVAPNEVKLASTWLWSSFSNLWRAYKIVVEIHMQQNSPHGFTVKTSREMNFFEVLVEKRLETKDTLKLN